MIITEAVVFNAKHVKSVVRTATWQLRDGLRSSVEHSFLVHPPRNERVQIIQIDHSHLNLGVVKVSVSNNWFPRRCYCTREAA